MKAGEAMPTVSFLFHMPEFGQKTLKQNKPKSHKQMDEQCKQIHKKRHHIK